MASDATQKVRSDEIRRRGQRNEGRFDAAESQITETRRRVQMTSMALQAKSPTLPQGKEPGSTHVLYEPITPGPDSQTRGQSVASIASTQKLLLEGQERTGEGDLELLRPGRVWAAATSTRFDRFEARLKPPRLVDYNEIHIPHIAGRISLDIYGPDGAYSIREVEHSRLIRLDEPKTFNGRVRVESRSFSTTSDGDYIHTLGGLSFFRSEWSADSEIRCGFHAPEDGQIEAVDASLRPTGHSPSFGIYVDGSEESLPLSVDEGQRLQLRFTGVSGTVDSSFARIELTY